MSDNQSSNQVPRATTGAVTTPAMTTCADISNSGDSGATAGGSAPANVDDVVYDLRQELFRRGQSLGYATEFVNINGKMIIKEVSSYVRAMIDAANSEGINIQLPPESPFSRSYIGRRTNL